MQRNGNYPLISSYEGNFVNVFYLESSQNHKIFTSSISLTQNLIIKNENSYIVESSDKEDEEKDIYEMKLAYLHGVLDKVFEIYIYSNCIFANYILIFY